MQKILARRYVKVTMAMHLLLETVKTNDIEGKLVT